MATEMTVRDQVSLFTLMMVARPVTNRELRDLAGLEITAAVRARANQEVELISTTKRGAVNTHRLTAEGRSWCESALAAGRPDGAKFPAGALYAAMETVGQFLARSDIKFGEFFKPDLEGWIRAVYTELTVRRPPGSWVKLSTVRPWLENIPREVVDAELDRMIEQPDVRLMAELNRKSLTDEENDAAVDIGGQARHLLKIEAE
ncbi:hypothetical protein QRX50_32650 [Amycolatopsis carbonis]|uniref:Uncharacterized protein n=1 Tax=Amycolatopsis carbonis TaxID=715471 RepID=A0A9Y2IBR9_9PSEU|nr:hypothetical protein [Amycolatopsis sp. 2-15]WIX76200.1 hypothetical protein QRX50_32650 [Amycolatopsis sp. 2-15]